MEDPADWPFEDPPNIAAITTRPIVEGTSWVALVSHDEDDGGWQFIGPEGAIEELAMIVALRSILQRDASIAELADLPLGRQAWRDSADAAWQRAPKV
jgi:hypothetical protein